MASARAAVNCDHTLFQVEGRAFQVWGGGEGLAEEQRRRAEAREKRQETKYVKTIKGMF